MKPKAKGKRWMLYAVLGVVVLAVIVIWKRKKEETGTASAQGTGELVAVEPGGGGAGGGAGVEAGSVPTTKGEAGEQGPIGEPGPAGATGTVTPEAQGLAAAAAQSAAAAAAAAMQAERAQTTAQKAAHIAKPHRGHNVTPTSSSTPSFHTGTYHGKLAHIHSGPVPGGVGPGRNIVILETAAGAREFARKHPRAVETAAAMQSHPVIGTPAEQPSRSPTVSPAEAAGGVVAHETASATGWQRVGTPAPPPEYYVGTYRGKKAHIHSHSVPGGVGPGHNIVIV